jgi:hypothetical protein
MFLASDGSAEGSYVYSYIMIAFFILIIIFAIIIAEMYKRKEKERKRKEWEHRRKVAQQRIEHLLEMAQQREAALDYDSAIAIWEEMGKLEEAARVRKLKAEQSAVKVTQKVVHGDEVTKTEIKDSVLNRSNIGSGGSSSKMQELKELTEMKEKGLIDDDEFK